MKIQEAIEYVKARSLPPYVLVRREMIETNHSRGIKEFIKLDTHGLFIRYFLTRDNNNILSTRTWRYWEPTQEDILADDWQVYWMDDFVNNENHPTPAYVNQD